MTHQPGPYAPTAPTRPKGLAIAALIVGIVAFLTGWVPLFAAFTGLVAVALGIIALVKAQPKALGIPAVILGSLGAITSILMLIAVFTWPSQPTPTPAAATPMPTATAQPTASPTPSATPPPVQTATPTPEPVVDYAAEYRQALLNAFGTDSFQSLPADMWAFYIADVSGDKWIMKITMQTNGSDPILAGSSRAAFSLIGQQFPDLQWIEVLDGTGVHVEQTQRSEVPLLN